MEIYLPCSSISLYCLMGNLQSASSWFWFHFKQAIFTLILICGLQFCPEWSPNLPIWRHRFLAEFTAGITVLSSRSWCPTSPTSGTSSYRYKSPRIQYTLAAAGLPAPAWWGRWASAMFWSTSATPETGSHQCKWCPFHLPCTGKWSW